VKLQYDPDSDAIYLSLADREVHESEEVRPGVVLDFDAADRVIGVELLGVRDRFPDADPSRVELEVA